MTVKIIEDKDLWAKFVDESPDGLLFHKWDFLKIMEKHTNYKLLSYGIYKGDKLIAIFPLFFKRYKGLKMVFSPPPQTGVPYLGFVMNHKYGSLKQRRKESYLNEVIGEINEEIDKFSPNYVFISLGSNLFDIRFFKWSGFEDDLNYTYVIDLEKSLDTIWNDFDKDCRREIRTTDKYDLSFKETDDVQTFYNILSNRYNEQGLNLPLISPNYFKDILSTFPKNIKMYFLYNADKMVDIVASYEYKKRLVIWKGYISLDKSIHSTEYLTWDFIKKAKSENFTKFEIQGANTKRLCFFKSKFNPSLEINYNIYKKDNFGKIAEWVYINLIKKRL
jgi:hypothetical protein